MARTNGKSNKKWIKYVGFCYVLLVVGVVAFTLKPVPALAGCSGPCFSCHENLIGNKDHEAMGTCAVCHDGTKSQLSIAPKSNINGGCGDRCFTCHNQWPMNAYHEPLDSCLKCHKP